MGTARRRVTGSRRTTGVWAAPPLGGPALTGGWIPVGQISRERFQIAASASERDVAVGSYEKLSQVADTKQSERSTIVDQCRGERPPYEAMKLDQPDMVFQQ